MGSEGTVAESGVSVELTNKRQKIMGALNSWRVPPKTVATAAKLSRSDRLKSVCGVWKLIVSFSVLVVGCGHLYLHFDSYDGFVPTFFILATLAVLLLISFVHRVAIVLLSKEKTEENIIATEGNNKCNRRCYCLFADINWFSEQYNSICDVNGKYYLVKMAVSEVIESVLHCLNFFTIFLCTMPLLYSSILGIIVIFNTLINAFGNVAIKSMHQRNFHISFDMVMDILMLTLPMAIKWFVLHIPTPVQMAVQLVLYPSIFFYSKAHDVWSELHRIDLLRIELALDAEKNGRRIKRSRSRDSIHHHHRQIATTHAQMARFPTRVRRLTAIGNIAIALFLTITLCFQFFSMLDNASCQKHHSSEVWNGCQVKLPFCKNPFAPTCDCSVLKLKNYSKSEFPQSVNMFTNLAGLYVYSGLLKTLPSRIYTNLIEIVVVDNRLSSIPEAIGEARFLYFMDVSSNELHGFPPSVTNLESLGYLYAKNNSIGNLPKHIGRLERLLSADFRNNRLSTIPDSAADLQHLHSLYMFGNPLCPQYNFPQSLRKLKGLCEKSCADGCRPHTLGNGFCNLRYWIYNRTAGDISNKMFAGCNVHTCNMDNGDCDY
jgi:hypothetical protein